MVSQVYEIGGFIGGTNYVGDIGRTNFIYPNKLAAAAIFKWNWNPRIAFRGTYRFLPIEGDDKDADTDFKVNRGLKFTNTIHEWALGMEWNFFEYDLSSNDKFWTPYILVELAAFRYKSIASVNATNQKSYTNKTSYAIPFGVGYKTRLNGDFAIAFETKFRYTFKDDLDYSTSKIPSLDFGGESND